jgi:thiamine biosynthesis lipoprotein
VTSYATLFWFVMVLSWELSQASALEMFSGRIFGTSYSVKIADENHRGELETTAQLVAEELDRIESIFSLYRPDSELSLWNQLPSHTWAHVSHDLCEVVAFAIDLSAQTQGAFDPTVRPILELWQLDRLSEDWAPPNRENIQEKLKGVGTKYLELQRDTRMLRKLRESVQLDLNALVEGWAIDRVLNLLRERGLANVLLEIGGEYGGRGKPRGARAWQVGIEDPRRLENLYAKVSVENGSLCTSGSYRQGRMYLGKCYSHIMDPRNGYPTDHDLIAVSVLHDNAMVADGWSTALLVLGFHQGLAMAEQKELAASFIRNRQKEGASLTSLGESSFERIRGPSNSSTGYALVWIAVIVLSVLASMAMLRVARNR